MADGRPVEFTEYALVRMRQRDILAEEVLGILDSPRFRHRQRPDGRTEVRGRVGRRTLLVICRRAADALVVINAMWE